MEEWMRDEDNARPGVSREAPGSPTSPGSDPPALGVCRSLSWLRGVCPACQLEADNCGPETQAETGCGDHSPPGVKEAPGHEPDART